MAAFFAYGTLEIPQVFEAVTGKHLPSTPANLGGHVRFLLAGKDYPGLIARPGAVTDGRLYLGISERCLRKLDSYEDRFYLRKRLRVQAGRYRVWAWVYVLSPRQHHLLSDKLWDRRAFEKKCLRQFLGTLGSRS